MIRGPIALSLELTARAKNARPCLVIISQVPSRSSSVTRDYQELRSTSTGVVPPVPSVPQKQLTGTGKGKCVSITPRRNCRNHPRSIPTRCNCQGGLGGITLRGSTLEVLHDRVTIRSGERGITLRKHG